MQDNAGKAANLGFQFHKLRSLAKIFATWTGEFVLRLVESSRGHCLELYYAARITEPIVSFLPSLRRIVRGLMCSN